MIFHIKDGKLVMPPQPEPKYRSWKRSSRREKRVRTVDRDLAELLDQALQREEWRESRREHFVIGTRRSS